MIRSEGLVLAVTCAGNTFCPHCHPLPLLWWLMHPAFQLMFILTAIPVGEESASSACFQ